MLPTIDYAGGQFYDCASTYPSVPMAKSGNTGQGKANSFTQVADQLGIPAWGRVLIVGFASATISAAGLILHQEMKLTALDTTVGEIKDTVKSIDGKLDKRLLSFRNELVPDLVHRAALDAKRGQTDSALQTLMTAEILVKRSTGEKAPAQPEYFEELVHTVNSLPAIPSMSQATHSFSVQLAQYRSTLSPRVTPQQLEARLKSLSKDKKLVLLDGSRFPSGADFFYLKKRPGERPTTIGLELEGHYFLGGSQTLDNFAFREVVFVRTHIKYKGGPLRLDNVKFIDCTFEFKQAPQARQVLMNLVQGEPSFSIPKA